MNLILKSLQPLFFLFLILCTFYISCSKDSVPTIIQFTAQTDEGDPVNDALIYINGSKIGTTNLEGKYTHRQTYKVDQKLKLEIIKESKDYFFSDHREIIMIPDENKFGRKIIAVLSYSPKNIDLALDSQNIQNNIDVEIEPKENEGSKKLVKKSVPTKVKSSKPSTLTKKKKSIKPKLLIGRKESDQKRELVRKKEKGKKSVVTKKPTSLKIASITKSDNQTIENPTLKDIRKASILGQPNLTPPSKPKKFYYHVQISDKKGNLVSGAKILVGWNDSGFFELKGKTNQKGELSISYFAPSDRNATVFVKKRGYQQASRKIQIKPSGKLVLSIKKAITIDILSVTKEYHYEKGVPNVEIFVGQKIVGVTDQFGMFTYSYDGPKGEVLNIKLVSREYFPRLFETDIIIKDSFQLKKYFQNETPPKPKISITPVYSHQFGKQSVEKMKSFELTKKNLEKALNRIFDQVEYSRVRHKKIKLHMKRMGLMLPDIIKTGWNNTSLNPYIDVIIVPELIAAADTKLFLNIYTSNGKKLLSIFEILKNPNSPKKVIKSLSRKLAKMFPFEGIINSVKDKKKVLINLGEDSHSGLKVNQTFSVLGMKFDQNGTGITTRKTASIRVIKVYNNYSEAEILYLDPKSEIQKGDRIIRDINQIKRTEFSAIAKKRGTKYKKNSDSSIEFIVRTDRTNKSVPVLGANIYMNNDWVGSTDRHGSLRLSSVPEKVSLLVHRFGYTVLEKEFIFDKGKRKYPINIQPRYSSIIISSVPNGRRVFVDGVFIGKTPILNPIEIPVGFKKIQVLGQYGYKTWEKVIEVTPLLVNLTGSDTVKLEKDFITLASKFESKKSYEMALKYYGKVSRKAKDYSQARHSMGRIYLENLNDPEKAAYEFEKVLSVPSNKELIDKRYVVVHTNIGIAYFKLGNINFNTNPKKSARYFKNAYENFEKANLLSKYFPKDNYERIKHGTLYYNALTFQKLYYLTSHQLFLRKADLAWQDYIDFVSIRLKNKTEFSQPLNNAKLYLAEVKASLRQLSIK